MKIENINRYSPLPSGSWRLRNTSGMRPRRGAEALGYGMQSPPARAMPDYFFKDHKPPAMQGEARLRGLASRPRQRPLPCSPSPSGRRRAVGVNPSAIQGKARLRGLCRIISSKTISPRLCKAKPACAGLPAGRVSGLCPARRALQDDSAPSG